MASGSSRLAAAAVVAGVLLLVQTSALAGVWQIPQGEPAPADGLLLDQEAARKVIEQLRDAAANAARLETVQAEREKLVQTIEALRAALAQKDQEARDREIAMAIAEDREQRRAEDQARMLAVLEAQGRVLASAQETIRANQDTLKAASDTIKALKHETFWDKLFSVLGTIGGVVVGTMIPR